MQYQVWHEIQNQSARIICHKLILNSARQSVLTGNLPEGLRHKCCFLLRNDINFCLGNEIILTEEEKTIFKKDVEILLKKDLDRMLYFLRLAPVQENFRTQDAADKMCLNKMVKISISSLEKMIHSTEVLVSFKADGSKAATETIIKTENSAEHLLKKQRGIENGLREETYSDQVISALKIWQVLLQIRSSEIKTEIKECEEKLALLKTLEQNKSKNL